MIGCLLAPESGEEALRALRVALGRLSPRVQLRRGTPAGAELALDLGRGRHGRSIVVLGEGGEGEGGAQKMATVHKVGPL